MLPAYTDFFFDLRDHRFDLFFIRHVTDIAVGFDSLRGVIGKRLVQVMLRTAVEADLCAGSRIGFSHRKTDPVSRSGNQSNLTLK